MAKSFNEMLKKSRRVRSKDSEEGVIRNFNRETFRHHILMCDDGKNMQEIREEYFATRQSLAPKDLDKSSEVGDVSRASAEVFFAGFEDSEYYDKLTKLVGGK